jgi:hypothetical protein
MNEPLLWDPARLAMCCDAIQESYRMGVELPDGDPRHEFTASVLLAGRAVMEGIFEHSPDAARITWLIDELPPDALRLLVFERLFIAAGHDF